TPQLFLHLAARRRLVRLGLAIAVSEDAGQRGNSDERCSHGISPLRGGQAARRCELARGDADLRRAFGAAALRCAADFGRRGAACSSCSSFAAWATPRLRAERLRSSSLAKSMTSASFGACDLGILRVWPAAFSSISLSRSSR